MNVDELTQTLSDILVQKLSSSKQMFDQPINFFTSNDWSFTRLQKKPILYTAIQGKSGEWNCYAQVRDEQAQFVFYSICPIALPRSPTPVTISDRQITST